MANSSALAVTPLVPVTAARLDRQHGAAHSMEIWGVRKQGHMYLISSADMPSRITCACVLTTVLVAFLLAFVNITPAVKAAPGADESEIAAVLRGMDRLAVVDNARAIAFFFIFYGRIIQERLPENKQTWLQGTNTGLLLPTMASLIGPVKIPMFCFLSGALSTGPGDARRIRNFLQFLVAPTLLFMMILKPVLVHSFHLPYYPGYEWYLISVIVWRGLALTLWWRLRKPVAVMAMLALSCTAGYWDLESGRSLGHMFCLNSVFGHLPFFAAGYALPIHGLCQLTEKAYQSRCLRFVCGMLVLLLNHACRDLYAHLPNPHGSYMHPWKIGLEFPGLPFLDKALFFARRIVLSLCFVLPTLVLLIFVLPRRQTWFTWMGRCTLYPYLFQTGIFHLKYLALKTWNPPHCTSQVGHAALLFFYALATVAAMVVLSSRWFRCLFMWCLEPRWLGPAIDRCLCRLHT